IKNLRNKRQDQLAQQILGDVRECIEEYGILEEEDVLIFHTDGRENTGVRYYSCLLIKNAIQ
ncbi:MAG: hypothetical protein EZS28_022008, partial [Streblomastix strix]